MASAKLMDQNRGPLKLQHDFSTNMFPLMAPRDLSKYNPSVDNITNGQNFRFRGYPAGNFIKHRDPVYSDPQKRSSASPTGSVKEKPAWFGKPQVFDRKKPLLDNNHEGLQYSSDKVAYSKQTPRKVRDPFREKTSAEIRKYEREQSDAEMEIMKYKEDRLAHQRLRDEEKRRDLEQLRTYDPWGKPGGGAPQSESSDNKRQRFADFSSTESQKGQGDDGFYEQFGRQGGGAPLKSESGHLQAELRADPLIRFQDTEKARHVVDGEIRYKRPEQDRIEYSTDLQQQIAEKALSQQQAQIQELKRELEMLKHDPFGKPGAGAPNKTQSGKLAITKTSLLKEDFPELDLVRKKDGRSTSAQDNFQYYEPWGKGSGYPNQVQQGGQKVVPRRMRTIDRDRGVTTQSANTPGIHVGGNIRLGVSQGAGAPIRTDSGQIITRMTQTLKKDNRGEKVVREKSDHEQDVYDPFGKAGAGAPLVTEDGQKKTTVYGRINHERMPEEEIKKAAAAHLLLGELKKEMEEQKNNTAMWNKELKQGAGELATVMGRGVVGKPRRDDVTGMLLSQHLPSTDVTKQRVNERHWKNEETPRYHTDLERAAEERKRYMELDKLKEKQESQQHTQKFNEFWGRPGAGAPNPNGIRIHDITNTLYSPRHQDDPYSHKYHGSDKDPSPSPRLYLRNTINSTHTNNYDYENGRQRRRDYKLYTPWASSEAS